MKTSENGKALIKGFEELRLVAYCDRCGKAECGCKHSGIWTIGWGHTGHEVGRGMVITEPEAEEYFGEDVAAAEAIVRKRIRIATLQQHEWDALVSFAFNCGTTGDTLSRKLNAGDRAGAAAEFDRWIHSGGKKINGLISRRAKERKVFEGKK